MTAEIIRSAHGLAAAGGALLVVEQPALDEVKPLNAEVTERGHAQTERRGRLFERGNRASEAIVVCPWPTHQHRVTHATGARRARRS